MFRFHKRNKQSKFTTPRKNRIRSLESLEQRQMLTVGCADFEQILDQTYDVDEGFIADHLEDFHLEGLVEEFTLRDGTQTRGFAQVSTDNLAGGTGREVQFVDALINFDFTETPQGLSILFGEYGGNLNLQINEEFLVFENFDELDGQSIGGVSVDVIGGNGNDMGVLTLQGRIEELKIGGQELYIDQVCLIEGEPTFDFGDAPDEYGTTNQSNGPYHVAIAGVLLGEQLDAELDGNPDVNSDGDDLHGVDDEDGVIFLDPVQVGGTTRVQVLPSTQGWLNAWVDFNRDGTFSSNEKVADALSVGAPFASNIVEIEVPNDAIPSAFGTHSRWRFSTTHDTLSPINDLEPNQFAPDGEVEDHLVFIEDGITIPRFDYGDAPDSYGTTIQNDGPSHLAVEGIRLGTSIDTEEDGQPQLFSEGDDANNVFDEDGVIVAPMYAGYASSVEVFPSTQGWLNGWIDFNGDGVFASNEKVADGVFLDTIGPHIVSFNVPADAQANDRGVGTHSRWRFSTNYQTLSPTNDLEPNQFPPDGEVEDHFVEIFTSNDTDLNCIEFEDVTIDRFFPSSTVVDIDPVGLKADFSAELFIAANGEALAGFVERQSGGQAGGAGQEFFFNNVLADVDFEHTVSGVHLKFAETGGGVNFEINGDFRYAENFDELDGQVVGGVQLLVTGGDGNGRGTLVINGGVDSFKIGGQELWVDDICQIDPRVATFDFGDAPDQYGTTNQNQGPYHVAQEGIHLGTGLDAEFDGNPDVNSEGDDLDGSDDEDGVIIPAQILTGQTTSIEVLPSVSGFLNAWIDFNRDGSFGPHEKIADGLPVGGLGDSNVVTFSVPHDAEPSDFGTHSRWRFSTTYQTLSPTNDLEPNQFAPDGEVEDHLVFIGQGTQYEWGDAPAPYATMDADNGAQHVYDPGVLLGDRVDADPDGQPTPNADGDDTDGEDDDDGVRFLNELVPGGDARVELTTVNGGAVNAWIDFNGDGVWDPNTEAVVVGRQLSPGTTVVNFPVPEDAKVDPENPTFSRWRITTDTSNLLPTGGAPDGFIPNGEVEDHPVFIVNPKVRGDFNGDRRVDHDDIGEVCRTFQLAGQSTDLNGDGRTDKDDLDILVHDILGTHYGDANLDGRFNSTDLVQVFVPAKYETGAKANWAEGDWNCDGVFDSTDLVVAFVDGGYTAAARRSQFAAAVDQLFTDELDETERKKSWLLV